MQRVYRVQRRAKKVLSAMSIYVCLVQIQARTSNAYVVQMAESCTFNAVVGGSTPSIRTKCTDAGNGRQAGA